RPKLVNTYGPTETTVVVTMSEVQSRITAEEIPIGRPIANAQVYVLDDDNEPVPIGVSGELYIGGAGLGGGYLKRSAMTAERFIPDAFSGEVGGRLYRTGDLVRWRRDGQLEFVGRVDDQVKVRGHRIELGEVEAAISSEMEVLQCVVVVREDQPGDQRLVAYVVLEEGRAGRGAELREQLGSKLPDYMVPGMVVELKELPLTANGKLDRRALPKPENDVSLGYETPVGEIETMLGQLWAEVLHVDQVGRHDNFFKLGGHSLLTVRLLERMRQVGLQTDVRTLFVTPTLAELAAEVDKQSQLVEVPPNRIPLHCGAIKPEMLPLVELRPEEIEGIVRGVPGGAPNVQDIYPLAPLQEGILFEHLLRTEGDAYVSSLLLGFDSPKRLEEYVDALQMVIKRHDILRTAV